MKISIIGTVGVPACYGGFETLVENLLDERDPGLRVYCSSKAYKLKKPEYKNAKLIYLPIDANGIQSIIYDVTSILHAVITGSNSLLILGVSGAPVLSIIKFFKKKINIVTNIDGLEWKRDKWGRFAKWYLKFAEKIAVQYSDVIIADNKGIADYVSQEYGVKAEIIAYGGEHALVNNESGELLLEQKRYALSLCRIEPENNVHIILESFIDSPNTLKFIGNWDNSDYGRSLKAKYSKYENIHLLSPIYDLNTLYKYRKGCDFYVHGHSAGGTNPSLVEIMHFGKDIFAFDCVYNRATTENEAIYFNNSNELKKLLVNYIIDLKNNGSKMKEIANRRYTWKKIKQGYFKLLDRKR